MESITVAVMPLSDTGLAVGITVGSGVLVGTGVLVSFGDSVGTRACLKKAFCKMCVTICGRFRSDEGAVAGYGNRIRVKYTAKWGVQIAGMIFQTRSSVGIGILVSFGTSVGTAVGVGVSVGFGVPVGINAL